MKKALICCIALILIMGLLSGCMKLSGAAITPTAAPSPAAASAKAAPGPSMPSKVSKQTHPPFSPGPSPSPTPTPPPAASIKPVKIKISTDVPDVRPNLEEYNLPTNLYEDESYIYVGTGYYRDNLEELLAVNKKTGKFLFVDTCTFFAYEDHALYLLKEGDEDKPTLVKWDTLMHKSSVIREFDDAIGEFIVIQDKIYFNVHGSLYAMNTDGSGWEKLMEGAGNLHLYKNKLYFSGSQKPVVEMDLDTRKTRVVAEPGEGNYKSLATINHDKLVYADLQTSKDILIDLQTLQSEATIPFAIWQKSGGDYILSITMGGKLQIYLSAYETLTGKSYVLTQLPLDKDFITYCLNTTPNAIYYFVYSKKIYLYRIEIARGKAQVEKLAEY
jgi:hypothetical protein